MPLYTCKSLCAAVLTIQLGIASADGRTLRVQDGAGLTEAIKVAQAGDIISLADGNYLVTKKMLASSNGSITAPITVRAEHIHGAHIRAAAQIAFEVSGSYWHFADLDIVGICSRDTDCEHAFHVVGASTGFTLIGSRIADFNAHVKVNADLARALPMSGLIENNEFYDSHPRHTNNPVAPINIDNAVGWVVRTNLIHDFQKDGVGEGSYGAFVKGGARSPIIERNLVFCARDAGPIGHMVGLSFGAHGMDANLCPPYWDPARTCDPEVSDGIMRNNIVIDCNDDGIYLNRSAGSAILFNTLVHTVGIEFRFPSSTGVARGNLMNGQIRATEGGQFRDGGNVTDVASPQELAGWFHLPAPAGRRLSLPGPDPQLHDDYCGHSRDGTLDFGAMQVSAATCALWQ
jgi:parallel beta-helix repeat protein